MYICMFSLYPQGVIFSLDFWQGGGGGGDKLHVEFAGLGEVWEHTCILGAWYTSSLAHLPDPL